MKLTHLSLPLLGLAPSILAAPILGAVAPVLGTVGGAVPGAGGVLPGAGSGGLPLVGGVLPGFGGAAGTAADLKVFADAVLKLTTGGSHSSCDALAGQLTLTAATQAQILTKFAYGACYTAYHDQQTCAGLAGYFASTYYAYISGWAGVDLFATLGPARVTHWHDLLLHTCSLPRNGPTCQPIFLRWDAYLQSSASLNLNAALVSKNLTNLGFLQCIDNPASLLGHLSVLPIRGLSLDSNTIANANAAAAAAAGANAFTGGSFSSGANGVSLVAVGHANANAAADVHVHARDLKVSSNTNANALIGADVGRHGLDAAALANAATVNDVKIGQNNIKLVSVGNAFAGAHASRDIVVNSNTHANAFTGVKLDHNGLDAAALANAATFNNVKVGNSNANLAGVAHVLAGASAHKRDELEARVVLLDRPLEVYGVGDGHLLSATELSNGKLASTTLGQVAGLLKVAGRDVRVTGYTTGEGSLRVGDIVVDAQGSAHVVGHVSA